MVMVIMTTTAGDGDNDADARKLFLVVFCYLLTSGQTLGDTSVC